MCDTCGCGDHELVPVEVQERILAGNDRTAGHNREHFRAAGVTAINLMGSPGAGKTAVLEATALARQGRRLAAVTGDLATENDAERLRAAGIKAWAITTGTACHLDASMIHHTLHHLPLGDFDDVFIENVGNLVCPAIYDLGQAANVVALSVTEGEDKPLKYPTMFHAADLVLITKVDLLPHLPGIRTERIVANLERVMPHPRHILLSATAGTGMREWLEWLDALRAGNARVAPRPVHAHAHHDHHHGSLDEVAPLTESRR
jgi:hydrogenase nickel incorporation protein HypB